MRNYAETFSANHGYNMVYNILRKYLSCDHPPPPPPLTPLQKGEVPQTHVFIFFLISSTFSISSTTTNIVISRGNVFRGDPKNSLFRYI